MKNTGMIAAIVIVVMLAVLLLGGVGMMGFGGFGRVGMMGGYGGMMGGYGNQFGVGLNPIGAIISLVIGAFIIGGIVLFVVWLAHRVSRSAGAQRGGLSIGSGESPLDILKARYAKGELTKGQFDAIKQDLGA